MSELILVHGEEEFLMERAALSEIEAKFINYTFKFKGEEQLPEYLEESQLETFNRAARAFLFSSIKIVPPLPVGEKDLLIIFSSGKKILEDSRAKRSYNFPKLKTYDDNNEVFSFILKEGETRNIDLKRIAGALFVNNGNCLRKISSEVRKLSVIADPGEVITPEKARQVMCFSAELTPKNVVDAVVDGEIAKALVFYDKLQENGDETGWIIAYFHRLVLQQLKMEKLCSSGVADTAIAETLKIHPFVFRKMKEKRLGLWSQDSLLSSSEVFAELDISNKRGKDVRFNLQLEIIRLAEESKKNVHKSRY